MKRIKVFLSIALIMGLGAGYLVSFAPTSSVPCAGGPYYKNSVTSPVAYGKVDTVAGATTDTFKLTASCNVQSLTFSNDVWKSAGTPTVTVALYASSNGGSSYGTTPLTTYTVTPTTTYNATPATNTYIVNQTGNEGNPYTNYMWVATNSASSTMSWQGSVTARL